MPSNPRPRGFSGGGGSSSSGRSTAQNTPMSERQQMALLMQMTSSNQAGAVYNLFYVKICTMFIVVVVIVVELSPGGQSYLPARSRDRNERGETALHVAAIKGDHEGVKKLLDQGMSPNVADFAGKKKTQCWVVYMRGYLMVRFLVSELFYCLLVTRGGNSYLFTKVIKVERSVARA